MSVIFKKYRIQSDLIMHVSHHTGFTEKLLTKMEPRHGPESGGKTFFSCSQVQDLNLKSGDLMILKMWFWYFFFQEHLCLFLENI